MIVLSRMSKLGKKLIQAMKELEEGTYAEHWRGRWKYFIKRKRVSRVEFDKLSRKPKSE